MLPIAFVTKRFCGAVGVLRSVRWIAEHAAASSCQRARMRDCRRCTSASICLLGGCHPLFTDLVLFHRQDLYVALTGCRGRKTFLQRLDSDFGACQTPELRSQLAQSFHHVKMGNGHLALGRTRYRRVAGPRRYRCARPCKGQRQSGPALPETRASRTSRSEFALWSAGPLERWR